MKIGICTTSDKAEQALDCGADFFEISAVGEVNGITDESFENLKLRLSGMKIKPYSCNGLIAGNVRLCGRNTDFDLVTEYVEKSFKRLNDLGVKMLVFGSGAARAVPEGFSYETAYERLIQVGRIFSEIAARYGQTIAVEPLRRAEVNIINTVSDAAEYIRKVDRANIKLNADFYHMTENGENFEVLRDNRELLAHIHVADRNRNIIKSDDIDIVRGWGELLNDIGYEGSVSYEGAWTDDKDKLADMFWILHRYFI